MSLSSLYWKSVKFSLFSLKEFCCLFVIIFILLYVSIGLTAAPSLEKGKKLFKEEKFPEAKTILEQVIKADPQNHEAYFILGKIYFSERNYDKSIENFQQAVALKDSVSDYHLWYGSSYIMKAQKSDKLKAIFSSQKGMGELEKAVKLDSTNTEARFTLFQYYLGAPAAMGGNKKKAEDEIKIIQSLDPFSGAQAWAIYWEKERDLIRAEEYLKEAAKLDTSSTFRAEYSLGYFYQLNNKYDKAITTFREILAKNPREMNALYQLGKTYILVKDNLGEAESCFKKYLKVKPSRNSPTWATAHWRLGIVYDLEGKKELARREVKKALELEPDNKEFKKTLQELQLR
jgi:tetratricopeptide (TPR) repeat protein